MFKQVNPNAHYITSFSQPPARGAAALEYAGLSGGPNGLVLPRERGKVAVDWTLGDFIATLSGNHMRRYKRGETGIAVNSYSTSDLFMPYQLFKGLMFTLAVTNLENKDPPIGVSSGVGPTPTLYDLRSRYVGGGFEYKFR